MIRRIDAEPGLFEHELEAAPHDGLDVLVQHHVPGLHEDPFAAWVVDGLGALLGALQDVLARPEAGKDVVLVVVRQVSADAWELAAMDAAVEAVRATMRSLTFELAGRARVNVVVCDEEGGEATATALRFLAGADGSYVAGSTFDLRSAA